MAAGPWVTSGNAGTNPPTDFLGTPDNQPLVIKTGNTERVRIDSSGHVGIGTSSPQYPLHIALGAALRIEGGTTATDATNYFSFGGNGTFGIDAPGVVNGRFVVLNSGNVGIGAAQPAASLSLGNFNGVRQLIWDGARNNSNDANCGFGINLAGTGSSLDIFMSHNYGLNIVAPTGPWPYPSYSAKLTVLPGGNVGIGAPAPIAKLDVRGQASFQGPLAINNASATPNLGEPSTDVRAAITFGSTDAPNAYYLGAYTSDTRANTILGVYSYQLNAWLQNWSPSGGVGIGTASPDRPLSIQAQRLGQELMSFKDLSGATKWHLNLNLNGSNPGCLNFAETGVADGRLFLKAGGNVGIGTTAPSTALHVAGDVTVTGDVILTGADCAEQFDASGPELPEPGAVVVIDESGHLRLSQDPYDKKVAGVVSGAGEYRHALVLDKRPSEEGRIPVALVGKVYCRVDAQFGPVEVGDLLTTSPTRGHAMKAQDPVKAFGAVIGKALRGLESGQGLVPILIALQ